MCSSDLVEQIALHRTQVLRPLLLQVNQRPLPPAEREVLNAGELKEIVLGIAHPMAVTVTLSGMAAASTLTE